MKIFLVKGSTGEYDCWHSWTLKAFASKSRAGRLVAKANRHAKAYYKTACPKGDTGTADDINFLLLSQYENPFDPHADMDYTGTKYLIEEVEFDSGN